MALGIKMNRHLALRVAVLTVCAFSIVAYPSNKENLSWWAALLIAIIFGPIQFFWLLGQRPSVGEHWSTVLSWRVPFFPMRRYAFRYWLFTGECLALGGLLAMLVAAGGATGNLPFGATFFMLGVAMMVASSCAFSRRSGHA